MLLACECPDLHLVAPELIYIVGPIVQARVRAENLEIIITTSPISGISSIASAVIVVKQAGIDVRWLLVRKLANLPSRVPGKNAPELIRDHVWITTLVGVGARHHDATESPFRINRWPTQNLSRLLLSFSDLCQSNCQRGSAQCLDQCRVLGIEVADGLDDRRIRVLRMSSKLLHDFGR